MHFLKKTSEKTKLLTPVAGSLQSEEQSNLSNSENKQLKMYLGDIKGTNFIVLAPIDTTTALLNDLTYHSFLRIQISETNQIYNKATFIA